MRYHDPSELLPRFRASVAELIRRLDLDGHKPRLHETYRSPDRSKALVASGRSRAKGLSMHCYRIAADIVCARHGWNCEQCGCDFYTRLGAEASSLGMTWGGNWDGDGVTREQREHDLPHVQGVPVAVQGRVRRGTMPDIEELLAEYLGHVRP